MQAGGNRNFFLRGMDSGIPAGPGLARLLQRFHLQIDISFRPFHLLAPHFRYQNPSARQNAPFRAASTGI